MGVCVFSLCDCGVVSDVFKFVFSKKKKKKIVVLRWRGEALLISPPSLFHLSATGETRARTHARTHTHTHTHKHPITTSGPSKPAEPVW